MKCPKNHPNTTLEMDSRKMLSLTPKVVEQVPRKPIELVFNPSELREVMRQSIVIHTVKIGQ